MTRKTKDQQLVNLTRSIIHSFYAGTPSLILEHLHSDVIWINNTDSTCLYGYYCVSSSLFKIPRIPCVHVHFGHSHLMCLSENTTIISCEYSVLSSCTAGTDSEPQYCSSFIWKREASEKLIYIHMSPAVPGTMHEEMLTIPGRHAEVYRIPPEEIMYIEASNVQCCIFLRSRRIEANQSISHMEPILPSYFMRTHRCFIVNKQYVRRIFRYGIELSNGAQLPIPEKRYMKVVCWLES